ncbi:MAG: ABC transporter substrate-binding protein [Burkholderiales bacterium]
MNRVKRTVKQVLFAAIASSAFVAAASFAQDWQAGAGDNWRKLMEAARKEGKVIVAGDVAPIADTLPAAFKRDTGIDMELVIGRTNELATRLDREARSGNVTVDVYFGGGTEIRLAQEGLLVAIKPQLLLPGVTGAKNWVDGKMRWFDKTEQFMFQGSNWVFGWPIANPKLVNAKSFTTWKDLLKPEFKGKIAAYDPRGGGPGQAAAAYLAEIYGIDFVKQLFVGQQVTYTRDNRQLGEWIARGTHAVGLGSIAAIVELYKSQGVDIAVPTLADGPGSLLGGFSVTKQPKGAPHSAAASVFHNWYASRPGQEVFAKGMLEPSTRVDVKVAGMPDYIIPKGGLKYLNQYDEDWYVKTRPKLANAVLEALGGR